MNVRSALGSLQVPIAGFGLLVAVGAVYLLLALPEPPADGDGFVTGLAALFLYAVGFVGFIVAALGFAIPPGDGFGVRFNRWQRRLFLGAAATALLSVVVPLVAWSLVASTGLGLDAIADIWLTLMVTSVIAFGGALGWRAVEEVARRFGR